MDFESIFEVIPRFDGTHPYQQVPFQFSVHIQRTPNGSVEHISFLYKSADDPRKAFISSLIKCMGDKGDVIVFNQSYEKKRLEEFADAYPEYSVSCQAIILRLLDLQVPFKKFHYLHPDQNGSASLKNVLPVLTGASYKDLEIADGGKASTEYARVTYSKGISAEEKSRVYNDLETYCTLDTKAMVDILACLGKIILE